MELYYTLPDPNRRAGAVSLNKYATQNTIYFLSFFLCVVFFRIMSGLFVFTVKLAVLITNVTMICGKILFCLTPPHAEQDTILYQS